MFTDTEICEAAALTELVGRRYKVRLIEGDRLGSSGYYPAEMLRRDGSRVFTKGTPMYLDHQTPSEKQHRPYGSVSTYAGELAEDAYYENDGLYADIEVFEHQIPLIKSLKDKIGISIRAFGKSVVETINGKQVPVFKELTEARSADFVVRAGAGGKIVSILESATEDSEADSEEQERETMDEVTTALAALGTKFDAFATRIEEALKPEAPAAVEESAVVDDEKVLEIAEALAASSLDSDGRARVLDLHRANGKPLAELITAEEAYVKVKRAPAEDEGFEEGAGREVEESAKPIALPRAWNRNKKDN